MYITAFLNNKKKNLLNEALVRDGDPSTKFL